MKCLVDFDQAALLGEHLFVGQIGPIRIDPTERSTMKMSLVPGIKDVSLVSVENYKGVHYTFDHCDKCSNGSWVRRIELGGGAELNLCASCFYNEMTWRIMRNRQANNTIMHVFNWDAPDPARFQILVDESIKKGELSERAEKV